MVEAVLAQKVGIGCIGDVGVSCVACCSSCLLSHMRTKLQLSRALFACFRARISQIWMCPRGQKDASKANLGEWGAPTRPSSPHPSPAGACLARCGGVCRCRSAENALFGSVFDFLKNIPQADLSGFKAPPGAKGVCNGLNMARSVPNKYLKKNIFWVMR